MRTHRDDSIDYRSFPTVVLTPRLKCRFCPEKFTFDEEVSKHVRGAHSRESRTIYTQHLKPVEEKLASMWTLAPLPKP